MVTSGVERQAHTSIDHHIGSGDMGMCTGLNHQCARSHGAAVTADADQLVATDQGIAQALGGVQFVALDQAGAVAVYLFKTIIANQAVTVAGDLFTAVVTDLGIAVVEDQLRDVALGAQVDFSCPARSSIDSSL